ncbi:MAG: hypothetical protein AAFX93_03790 [Verrucomicrobiota bacterium]
MAESNADNESQKSCTTGGCGGKGMCPGVALLIGFVAGVGVSKLLGVEWTTIPVAIVIALPLVFGVYPGGGNWPIRTPSR